jgi:hypothetical protein
VVPPITTATLPLKSKRLALILETPSSPRAFPSNLANRLDIERNDRSLPPKHYHLRRFTRAQVVRSDRGIAYGILRALSSDCHPEERRDEGSAVALQPISGKIAIWASPSFTTKQERTAADPSLRSG